MLIEVRGVQFVNKGAELMLRAVLAKIKDIWPHAKVCLQAGTNTRLSDIQSIGAYRRINLKKNLVDLNGLTYLLPKVIRNWLAKKYNLVFEADIDLMLDASGFAYGDQWSTLILRQVTQDVCRFDKKQKPYIFLPQALGPFTKKENREAAVNMLSRATAVFAREIESFQHARALSNRKNVFQAPDFTNLLTPQLIDDYQHLAGQVAIIPNSKMLSKKNLNNTWLTRYIDVLVDAIEVMQEQGQKVFLLNHEGIEDQNVCLLINQRLCDAINIVEPRNALDVKSIISQCKLVICSRFHGCVSALSQGVPCIATSWSHKYEQLFSEYQQKTLLQANYNKDDIARLIREVIDNEENEKLLTNKSEQFAQQSLNMWRHVAQFVKS